MLIAGAAGLALAVAGTGAVVANGDTTAAKHIVVKQKQPFKFKANRYLQDGLRFDKDTYRVQSGGTVTLKLVKDMEGPHTLSVVKKSDLPTSAKEVFNCKVCQQLGQAHGADPNSHAPPKYQYLENGKGQNTPPNLNKPGDSGITGPKKGDVAKFKVTAKPGTTLHFMCIIHGWMQATIKVE